MNYLAEAECQRKGWAFPETFRNQYAITHASAPIIEGWQRRKHGPWRIQHCPDLPLCELRLMNGRVAAIVIGHAISEDGIVLQRQHKMPIRARETDRVDRVEKFIAGLAGRFTVLLVIDGVARVYPDPVCGLGPVYCKQTQTVAASTTLAVNREHEPSDDVSIERVTAGAARFLFGHTADAHVQRARSNHYIDLDDFTMHRFWPKEDDAFDIGERSLRDVAEEITTKLGANIRALTQCFKTALPITGGTDSRLLLAAGHDSLDDIDQFFVYQTNWANKIDTDIAQEGAQSMCLPLRVISHRAPLFKSALSPFELRQIMKKRMLRGGLEPDTSEIGSIKAVAMLPDNTMVLRGNIAEMTRALRWHRTVFDDPHNTEFALAKLEIRKETADNYGFWEAQFLEWKAELPAQAMPRLYDFLHSELWVPHTNSVIYMRETDQFFINPFNDRRLIQLTASVKPMARQRQHLVNHMISMSVPHLRDFDYKRDRARAMKLAAQAS